MIASIALNPSFTLSSFHKTLGFLPSQPAVLPTSKAFSSKPNQNHGHYLHRGKGQGRKLDEHHQDQGQGRDGDEENDERHVHCEVDVVSWRERRVRARVLVHADVETVWSVLTDYERLADFIPNLVYSWRIPCPHKGRIWLEQRGMQGALYWHIEARVVLDLQELPNLADGRELHFTMVDGDFKKFEGKWSVKAGPRSSTATLAYEVNVIPRFNFPAIFLERIIRSDLPVNLQALAWRAEQSLEGTLNYKPINGNGMVATSKDPLSSSSLDLSGAVSDIDVHSTKKIKENYACGPMTSSPSIEFNSKWGVYGKVCRLHRPCMVDEVHLRKYDGLLENGGTHRCVIASITVKAPVREVWDVLTAYDALPEIVPNLAISKILSRDNNKVRILQEGCKGLLYMVFHARVVLDLHEKLEQEISFEQVEGDFDSFQGKWLLEQLGNQHTLLKYVVESKMRKDTFLSEAIVEEVIYEDLPSNLCAIRDFVEKREAVTNDPQAVTNDPQAVTNDPQEYSDNIYVQADKNVHVAQSTPTKQVSNSDASGKLRQRPKVPGLQRDIEVLKAELLTFILKYGQEGFMPMRKQLRLHGRVDIEKAVSRMGGFRKIANMMNLSLAYKYRKPKGYWDNLENLQEEIIRFQRNWGMDPAYMPSRKSFERAGRYDIARALEKWGGIQEVSRLLSLELRHPRRRLNSDRESQHDGKSLDDPNDQEKMSSKPYVSQDTQRWLTKLKELDINWVE